jgi:hypothetical protein
MEANHEDRWVTDQLAMLDPVWQPDPVRGRAALELRLRQPRPYSAWRLVVFATATACIAVFAFPQTRAAAQGLWDHFVLNHVDIVRVDLSDLPLRAHVTTNGMSQVAHDEAEAEHLAGFKPNLPAGVLSSNPQLTVTGPIVAEQTIRVSDLRSALARRGAADVEVPAEWDGVTLRAIIGPMLAADYPGEVQILQSRPVSLSVPSGFPLEAFANAAFRSIGISSRDAASMARKFAANPSWLVDIPPDEVVNLQELSLVNGPALLTEEYGDTGAIERETVIRSTPDRLYAIMSPSRDLSVKIAAALP